jgi:ureidoglycolate lyase
MVTECRLDKRSAAMQTPQTLTARPIDRDSFAPHGWLIEAAGDAALSINAGSSQRFDDITELAFDPEGGVPCLAIFRAQRREIGDSWQEMERHRLGTQTFIPLGGIRYVVLVAGRGERPEPSELAAFLVNGRQGITLRPGTWHHALLALDAGDFVVLERRAQQVDCDIALLPRAVRIALG